LVNIFKIFGENKVKRFFNRIAVGWRESNFYFRRGTPSVIENAEGFFRQLPRGRSLLPDDPLRVAVMFTMRLHARERAYANQPPCVRGSPKRAQSSFGGSRGEVASLRAGGSSFFKAKVTFPLESHKDFFVDPCAPRRLVLSVPRCYTPKTSQQLFRHKRVFVYKA